MQSKKTVYFISHIVILFIACLTLILLLTIALLLNRPWRFYVAAVAFICTLLMILYFVNIIWKRYREMRKIMVLFSGGYTYDSLLELRCYFSHAEELMIHKFSELVNKNALLDMSKKQAEYLALQNQINPHFLYNTLECIRSEALTAGLNDLSDMTEAMAKYFRYSIFNVDHLVHLEDELMNIDNYFHIQRYRFGDKLNLVIDSDADDEETAYHCYMPKMTLQPIVENAVYHGIEPKIGKGTLRIKIELTQDRLIVIVSDNGLGMKQSQLEALNSKLSMIQINEIQFNKSDRNGIALINVNTRIKLLFGEAYGLQIFSTPNVGTDVVITLPLNVTKEDA